MKKIMFLFSLLLLSSTVQAQQMHLYDNTGYKYLYTIPTNGNNGAEIRVDNALNGDFVPLTFTSFADLSAGGNSGEVFVRACRNGKESFMWGMAAGEENRWCLLEDMKATYVVLSGDTDGQMMFTSEGGNPRDIAMMRGQVSIKGVKNRVQFLIKGAPVQGQPIFQVEKNDGTPIITVDNNSNVGIGGSVEGNGGSTFYIHETNNPPTQKPNHGGYLFVKEDGSLWYWGKNMDEPQLIMAGF